MFGVGVQRYFGGGCRNVIRIRLVGNDFTFHVVEEGIAFYVFKAVGTARLTKAKNDGERAGRESTALQVKVVFNPTVFGVFHQLRVDVLDLHLVKRLAANGVRYADVSATLQNSFAAAVEGQVGRLYPKGNVRRGACLQGDGGAAGVFLRRTNAVRVGVVNHQYVGIVGIVVRAGVFNTYGYVVDVDVELIGSGIVEIQLVRILIVIAVVPRLVELQLVVSAHRAPKCRSFRFGGGRFAVQSRFGQVFPRRFVGVDDTACRLGRNCGTRRSRVGRSAPARRRSDDQVFTVVPVHEFKTAVVDTGRIRFNDGGIRRGVVARGAVFRFVLTSSKGSGTGSHHERQEECKKLVLAVVQTNSHYKPPWLRLSKKAVLHDDAKIGIIE